jgi:tetratricopeptide (TPR) repeat protein
MKRTAFRFAVITCVALAGQAARAADFSSADGPDLSRARELINARDYRGALTNLATFERTQHPDVYSLMGYSYRKSGDQAHAFEYYSKALAANPDHRGALEYQGELFVEVGQIDRAKENLAHLQRLCPSGCEEREDLEDAIKGK